MSRQQKVKVAPVKKVMPKMNLISYEEYSETIARLNNIQNAADAAIKSINNLKALIATTFR